MKVSVVLPVYQQAAYVAETIASVQAQTFDDFELIVVDDGSSDGTADVLATIDDPRMTVVRIPNSGTSAARNTGLARARGEYIAGLDGDDRWRPDYLERTVGVLDQEREVVGVFSNFVRFDERGVWPTTQFDLLPEFAALPSRPVAQGARILTGDAFESLLMLPLFPVYAQATVVRASRVGALRFPEDIGLSQDLYYMANVYRHGAIG